MDWVKDEHSFGKNGESMKVVAKWEPDEAGAYFEANESINHNYAMHRNSSSQLMMIG